MARKLADDPFADLGATVDDPFADLGAPSPAGQTLLRTGIDVAKQIPSAVVGAAESALTFPAQATGFLGGLVDKVLPESVQNAPLAGGLDINKTVQYGRSFIPGLTVEGGEAQTPQQQQQAIRELTEGARKPLTRYVPDPETRAGQLTRQGLETAITTAVSPFRGGLSVPRAAGVGATAGVTGEVARQATEGTAAEPYAQIGGTLLAGTLAARQAGRAATRAATPTIEATKTAGGMQYDAFRNSGFGIDPAAGQQFSGALKAELNTHGLTNNKIIAEGTHDILDKIAKQPFTTPQKFHEAYQELGAAARSTNPTERQAASIAQERLLGMLEHMPPNFITGGDPRKGALLLQQANQNWAAAKRAENVSGRIVKAEQVASGQYSGLGLENELRRRMGVLGLPPEAAGNRPPSRGFTEAERQQFEQFGKTGAGNIRRYVGNMLAGGGGIGVPVVGGVLSGSGGALGYFTGGDPITGALAGAATPLVGLGLRYSSNRSALARARDLERMLLRRSELAMRPGRIPAPAAAGFPLTTLAPTLANLGEGE